MDKRIGQARPPKGGEEAEKGSKGLRATAAPLSKSIPQSRFTLSAPQAFLPPDSIVGLLERGLSMASPLPIGGTVHEQRYPEGQEAAH